MNASTPINTTLLRSETQKSTTNEKIQVSRDVTPLRLKAPQSAETSVTA